MVVGEIQLKEKIVYRTAWMNDQFQIREWIASDGYRIKYRYYPAKGKRKGIIVSLHGIQSHSGWYDYSSRVLSEAGYEIRFLDRRGSGQNSSQRGHAANAERLIQDVLQFLSDLRHKSASKGEPVSVYLLGLSWGGKLAAVIAGREENLIDGLILLYPGICARVRPNVFQKFLLNLVKGDRFRFRKGKIPLRDSTLFTNETDWQKWIENDLISLQEGTVSFFRASVELDCLAMSVPEKLSKPLLLMLAGKDRIVDSPATKEYFERFSSSKKKLIEYPDAAHTLEFEPNREPIFQDLLSWLNSFQKTDTESEPSEIC